MMPGGTSPVPAGEGTTAGQGQEIENVEGEELGRDAFLELLVTQLGNQDPLEPMDNREFISQMAQFSSLEQMENMNSTMEDFLETQSIADGAQLIGHNVETLDSESGEEITAEVTSVSHEDGDIYLHLEGYEDKYPLQGINSVTSS